MRLFSPSLPIAVSTLLLVSVCSAQQPPSTSIPNLISYGGTLKDAQGVAVSSTMSVGVTFAIYKQQDGGVPIWQETQNVTPAGNGQYSVILGSTTATGLPDDLFSQQEQRWLGVQVQGEAEQARVLLVSVPYAFKAHDAETLGGLPASAFVKAETTNASGSESMDGTAVNALSTAGIAGSTMNASKLATRKPPAPAGVVNGPCSSASNPALGYIPMFTGTTVPSDIICNSVIFQSGGSIGIGTTTPVTTLDVNGDVNVSDRVNAASYLIDRSPVLSIPGTNNLFVGIGTIGGSTGSNNTYSGYFAGSQDTGSFNTISGAGAGLGPSTGSGNAYFGYMAGNNEGNGSANAFFGDQAGLLDTGGSFNSFLGADAGSSNTTGSNNTYSGYQAGYGVQFQSTGGANTFIGSQAGYSDTTGSQNAFLGYQACYNIAAGNNNICVGDNVGPPPGGSGTSNTIWIGAEGAQTTTYIAGIYNEPVGAGNSPSEVCIDNTGLLGTVNCPANLSSHLVAGQQETIKQQQQQIQIQGQQIADLQGRLSRLEALIAKK